MSQTMKFQPGSFLEVEDLHGGRKVVMVGRDGVTMWDSVDPSRVTPISIHPVFKPISLGALGTYVQANGLGDLARSVLDWLRANGDRREDDALFVVRMIWSAVTAAVEPAEVTQDQLQAAFRAALAQEARALRTHELVGSVAQAGGQQ